MAKIKQKKVPVVNNTPPPAQAPAFNMILVLILLGGFYIRTLNLETPLLDVHSWRQTQTAMFARNFYQYGYNIFLPQIDWAGDAPGYIEAEFQLYPYLVAILYKFFGVKEVLGKLLSAMFSILGAYFLYLLSRRFFNLTTSYLVLICFLVSPLNVFFSRTFMPEATMLFFSISSIYFFVVFSEENKDKYLLLSALMTTGAFLVKIPTVHILLPLFYLALCRFGFRAFINLKLYLFLFLIFAPTTLWYVWAYQLGKMSGLTVNIWNIGTDKWGNLAVWTDPTFYTVILNRIHYSILTPILTPFAILGFFIKCRKKEEYVFHLWILAVVIYFFAAAIGNKVHSYYQLPIIPALSVLAIKGLSVLFNERIKDMLFYRASSFLTIVILISFAVLSYVYIKPSYQIMWPFYYAAQEVKEHAKKDDLILVADWSYPEVLYYSERKGYHINPWETTPEVVEGYTKDKVKYLVIVYISKQNLPPHWREYLENSKVVKEEPAWCLIKLK